MPRCSGARLPPLGARMLAAVMAASALCKLAGTAEMAACFARWGWPEAFMRGIGGIELVGSALLLAPSTARWGGLVLISLQTGALFTRCVHGESAGALVSSAGLAAALLVTWGAAPEEP